MSILRDAFAWLADPAHWSGPSGILMRLLQHLGVTGAVVITAALIALPLGIAIGHTGRFRFLATSGAGAARAVPTLGLLTLAALWLGIGLKGPFLALLVLAVAPVLSAAYAGIESADARTVDAARAIGLTELRIIREVELPAARNLILGGLRSATLQVVATATLAAYTADSGLGRFLYTGLKTRDYGQMIAGAILVIILALALDAAWALIGRAARARSRAFDTTPA